MRKFSEINTIQVGGRCSRHSLKYKFQIQETHFERLYPGPFSLNPTSGGRFLSYGFHRVADGHGQYTVDEGGSGHVDQFLSYADEVLSRLEVAKGGDRAGDSAAADEKAGHIDLLP
ncbi:hypothetical protein GR183_13260 [Stappia sp. GBMRC 2046]|uniref:Uncharacterized protein n=1 Tax=Stappia sediminis TaxID=2692190 RepID=A0A7X3LVN1_9HYPH|nr:hypothetical protein [Stappia sediminis]MXN65875.1 hypothetical protein [Stappia sediminis]